EALSKRLGTLALRDLREQGVEPAALLSHMARLGSSDPVELRTDMAELIDGFDITKFGAAPTKFDVEDLFPLTGRYLQTLPIDAVRDRIDALGVPGDEAEPFWLVIRDNIQTLNDLQEWWRVCSEGAEPAIDAEDQDFVIAAMDLLPDTQFDETTWSNWTAAVKEATGRKGRNLFMPLRKALTGQSHGPDMGALMPLLKVIKARQTTA
ncbi:MAG: glutamate--tRNA ligase, partial [Pseudomonadota bacterium]